MKLTLSILSIIALFLLQSCQTRQYVVASPINQQYLEPILKKSKLGNNSTERIDEFSVNEKVELSTFLSQQKKDELLKIQQVKSIIEVAESYLGTPYRMGGTSRRGIDCSAFVLNSFLEGAGIELPRVSSAQAHEGVLIDLSEAKAGDLLFFSTNRRGISHVGIVKEILEDGTIEFIHSASTKGVSVSNLNDSYWRNKFRFAKRVLTQTEGYSMNR